MNSISFGAAAAGSLFDLLGFACCRGPEPPITSQSSSRHVTWHIVAVILGCFVLAVVWHAVSYFLTCAFFTDLRGYLAPCVCEACFHCAGRQAQSDSNVALMFIALLEFIRSLVKAILAVSKVLCDCCSVVLIHPRVSTAVLITAGFIASLL